MALAVTPPLRPNPGARPLHPARKQPFTAVCLWSGPRNVSTALMYSFAQRSDAAVVDEPLYGHYLRVTGAEQPGRDELLPMLETDGEKAVRETILDPRIDKDVYFIKNMAHHLVDLDESFLSQLVNIFLIRDPAQMLPSLANQIPKPTMRDAGLRQQAGLFRRLQSLGQDPAVLDSRDLLLDPAQILRELCRRIDIPFEEAMLSWEPGPRVEDGPWAPYWYHSLHESTGFQPYREKTEPFPELLRPLLEECQPHYEFLYAHAIRAK